MSPEIVAGLVFLAIYALIVTEKIHRTVAALLGASLMILLKIVDQREAFASVDFNVIFLLAGMMIIANITAKTGVFQWIAVEAVRRAGGRPYALLVLTSLVTAVVSAFLDNVTTVVLLTPVVFSSRSVWRSRRCRSSSRRSSPRTSAGRQLASAARPTSALAASGGRES